MTKRERILHCREKGCGKASPSYCVGFKRQMEWLRRHRKKKHPTAHKKSIKKTVATKKKKKGNPTSYKTHRAFLRKFTKGELDDYERFFVSVCGRSAYKEEMKRRGGNPCK